MKADFFFLRDLFDHGTPTQENGHAKLPLVKYLSGTYDTGHLPIGKNDPFGVLPEFLINRIYESHTLFQQIGE